jgi:Sensors of blue-light using FAD
MPLIELTYLSTLTDASGVDLPSIVQAAARKNHAAGITGMLLCVDGSIMQTLEGEQDVVEKLFFHIKADTRHYGMVELIRESIVLRKFTGWSVGYGDVENQAVKELAKMGSVFKFSKDEVGVRMRAGTAMTLLGSFGG